MPSSQPGQILSGLQGGYFSAVETSSYISRLLGADDRKQANHVAVNCTLYSSLCSGIITTIIVIEVFVDQYPACAQLQRKPFCHMQGEYTIIFALEFRYDYKALRQ